MLATIECSRRARRKQHRYSVARWSTKDCWRARTLRATARVGAADENP